YFYRVVTLSSIGHPETLACATRQGGIAALAVPGPDTKPVISSSAYPGLDIVDVCSLGSGTSAPGVCAVGMIKPGRSGACRLVYFGNLPNPRHTKSGPSTFTRASRCGHAGLMYRRPSRFPMVLGLSPVLSASCSWVSPAASRNALSRVPNGVLGRCS